MNIYDFYRNSEASFIRDYPGQYVLIVRRGEDHFELKFTTNPGTLDEIVLPLKDHFLVRALPRKQGEIVEISRQFEACAVHARKKIHDQMKEYHEALRIVQDRALAS